MPRTPSGAAASSSSSHQPHDVTPHTLTWLEDYGTNEDLTGHLLSILDTVSPCSTAFSLLEQVPGFICAHFIDVTDPGEVRAGRWCAHAQHS